MKRYDIEACSSHTDCSYWEAIESKNGQFVEYAEIAKIIHQVKPIIETAEKNLQYSVEDLHKGYWQGTKYNLQTILSMLEGE